MCESGQDRPALTPAMIEAGVLALVRHYDPDEDGLGNAALTVRAILLAAFDSQDHGADLDRGVSGELS